ncbi:hypothetical protein KFE25_012961 [Diacronema lutheri]|uniref:Thioredoxin domain-containing protein n=1 Tax=Diacronema lutheri TaxID=2081491 RepID=A0A8J5X3Y0_DIALT|nr:hypothetical protein KFE25_012961 [Diacronema lutheri]
MLLVPLLLPLAAVHDDVASVAVCGAQPRSLRSRSTPPALASIFIRSNAVDKLPEDSGRKRVFGSAYGRTRREPPTDLLCFYGNDCEMCDYMAKYIARLERECPGVKVKRFETWSHPEHEKLRALCDKPSGCGGVPFFYNKKTKSWICGATTYDNLKRWARNKSCASFLPPPTTFKSQQPPKEGTGAMKVLSSLRERTLETLEEKRKLTEEARELKAKK